jgi:type I restriction enzyme R subunit
VPHRGTETTFELTTIERLEQLVYGYRFGPEIDRPHDEVVFKDVLRANLAKRYADLPAKALDEAVAQISRPQGVDTLRRNMAFHQMLVRGFELSVEFPGGRKEHRHIHAIDWDNPEQNEFLVVNQLPIHGQNDRRPDILIYINGLPLVVFELKNPYSDQPTVDDAFNQIQHYRHEIGQLFDYNALTVISDGVTTLHGQWPANMEWYAPWKSIDGFEMEPGTTGTMKTLIEGLFPKDRLLQYIRDFIVFEGAGTEISAKKGAKYHQFFAVRLAADKTVQAMGAIPSPRPSPPRGEGVSAATPPSRQMGEGVSMEAPSSPQIREGEKRISQVSTARLFLSLRPCLLAAIFWRC